MLDIENLLIDVICFASSYESGSVDILQQDVTTYPTNVVLDI